jgi:uncharacterized protein YndB with AHSA1/START domain/pimeloyl-ACP methyl ester carboxylesterase
MTVTGVRKDPRALTMTIDAEFDAPPERVWQLWADPRQLERWWGPPTYPATFTRHDLAPGSRVEYHMTGPEGDQPHGYWDIVEVDPPRSLVFQDGFANDDGSPNPDLPPTTARVTIEEAGGGRTRMSIENRFPSTEAMEQVLALGAEEGLTQAVGQIDAILAQEGVSATTPMTTHTLEVPGATLTYDVRRNDASTEPVLLMIASPMGAAGFGTLSRHFTDRTVVTYDPRGVERSTKTDPAKLATPDVHADDLHRLIQAIGGGPVDLFASSGGAVNALALVSKHPEDVRTLVAHEPPLATVLPDREHALAGTIHRGDRRPAGSRPGDLRPAGHRRRLPHRPDAQRHRPRLHPLRARLRRHRVGVDTDRPGRRGGVGGRAGQPWRLRRRRAARHQAGAVPERPRRLPRRRVRPDRRPGRLRGQAPRGPGRHGLRDGRSPRWRR